MTDTPHKVDLARPFDVVVVGGGPAGLTCALFLARARRRVLVIDNGRPRNYASHGIHGFLGQHGITPAELHQRGRQEAAASGAEFLDATARHASGSLDNFQVATDQGLARARRLVLAMGLRDQLPEIPRFEEFYGRSIFHCPDCDGYEVSDRRVGVIGWTKKVVGLALQLRQWTPLLTVLTHGHPLDVPEDCHQRLAKESIAVEERLITQLHGPEGRLEAIEFDDGRQLEFDAAFFAIGLECPSLLPGQLECKPSEVQPHLEVNSRKETSMPGVYAIGDLIPGSQLAVTAAADGAIAAIAINKSLLPDDWTL